MEEVDELVAIRAQLGKKRLVVACCIRDLHDGCCRALLPRRWAFACSIHCAGRLHVGGAQSGERGTQLTLASRKAVKAISCSSFSSNPTAVTRRLGTLS